MRRLVVRHAEVSLQLMKSSFTHPSALGCSSPVNKKDDCREPERVRAPAKQKKGKANKEPAEREKVMKPKPKMIRKLLLSRQHGVLIAEPNREKSSYANVAKKLKVGLDTDTLRVEVSALKHTRSGAISMVVGKGEEGALAAVKLKAAVEAIFGIDAGVWLRSNLFQIEVYGVSIDDNQQDIISL